jgi:hypothetical protein
VLPTAAHPGAAAKRAALEQQRLQLLETKAQIDLKLMRADSSGASQSLALTVAEQQLWSGLTDQLDSVEAELAYLAQQEAAAKGVVDSARQVGLSLGVAARLPAGTCSRRRRTPLLGAHPAGPCSVLHVHASPLA